MIDGDPEGQDYFANLLGYLRQAKLTERLHRHRVKVKSSSMPAARLLLFTLERKKYFTTLSENIM